MTERKVTCYPDPLSNDLVYGTLGTPGVDEVCVLYEGEGATWTPEEMEQVEQRIILPYMSKLSRCGLRAIKKGNFPNRGQYWFYGQYYNWRFGISRVGFNTWIEQMEDHHKKYSKRVDADT